MGKGWGFALAAAALALGAPAQAANIVDTGPGSAPPFFLVAGGLSNHGEFTLAAPATITGIEIYGFIIAPGAFRFSIASDGGNEPGASLFSQSAALGAGTEGWHGVSGLSVALGAGTYWLGFGADGSSGLAYHYGNAPNPLGNESRFSPGTPPSGRYVDIDPANFAWRVTGAAVAPVPEPATWALMIVGFAGLGASLRARRRPAAIAAA